MARKINQKKAGDSVKGFFEAGEVVTTQDKKTVQQGLVTSTMKPKTDKSSFWNSRKGVLRRIEMIEQNLKGTLSGAKTSEAVAKDAKKKIADLKKQLKALED
jgi:hypothetical protein